MNKTITVNISPAGKVVVEAQGFKGQGCEAATEMIEIAIGGAAKKTKKKKPEYFQGVGVAGKNKLTF